MILKSGALTGENLRGILESPEDFIDGKEYFSWERYFTAYLRDITKDDRIRHYSKERLAEFYLNKTVREKMVAVLPKEMKDRIS